jgi:hypothetical protein
VPLLSANELVKSYGGRRVVDGVSFTVDAGEIVGILGRNGAGKTTSFRMAIGMIAPESGSVEFDGRDVTRLPMYQHARAGMGYLAQEPSVFQRLTCEQNLMAILQTLPLTGKWYAPKFANATYATRLSQSSDLLGVFEVTQGGITLRGVVSPADGDKRTELSYAPPPAIVAYPLQLGAKWKTKAAIEGVAPATPGGTAFAVSNASEEYDAEADALGELKTPFGTFQVIRVRTILTRTLPSLFPPFSATTKVRSYAWITECFGTVVSATSNGNETNALFTTASELQRIAP